MKSELSKQFKENYIIAKRAASEGIVLLENNGVLPLKKDSCVAPVGKDCFNLVKGGGGSADVYSEYVKSLIDGLNEQAAIGNISVCGTAVSAYNETNVYDDETIGKIAVDSDCIIVTVTRYSGEGWDRKPEKGDYYLSDEERTLFDKLQNCGDVKNIIVVLNFAGVSDVLWISEYSKIGAVLLCWLPGMEGGSAIAEILCGVVNPSGRLTDTFAKDYYDYPSARSFNASDTYISYDEDIFVGYRYFETMAQDRVVYPFGYGLSYTNFEYENICFGFDDDNITVTLDVKNVGSVPGKDVVQLYVHPPKGSLPKPEFELKGYKKTNVIMPGEQESVTIDIAVSSLASFDDVGATGFLAAWVIEGGVYEIYAAKNVRERTFCGSMFVDETYVAEQLSLKLCGCVPTRLNDNGEHEPFVVGDYEPETLCECADKPTEKYKLIDVANGKVTLEQFISQLSDKQLIDLGYAQPSAFPRGTAGIGNLKEFGIVNSQTADGPLGLRKTTPTTCFPCPTLVACTWDDELEYQLGKALGFEGVSTKVDILLAPALNIHRDPLCGRNFEYYSEDPLISGKTASAEVRGIQSEGMAATIKHFAANNKETNRYESSSLVSERALREIYLKGFEICVKQAKPWALMTSYNLINGVHPSENYNLLKGVLRGEWGYDGAVMSDWRNHCHQYSEIKAGQNVKMPYGYPEELALTYDMLQKSVITRAELEDNAKYLLKLIMKTDRFKRQDFDAVHHILPNKINRIKAAEFTGSTTTWCSAVVCRDDDGGYNIGGLGRDIKGNPAGLIYQIITEDAGKYRLNVRIATPDDRNIIAVLVNDERQTEIRFDRKSTADDPFQDWFTVSTEIDLKVGEQKLTLEVDVYDQEDREGISINWFELEKL